MGMGGCVLSPSMIALSLASLCRGVQEAGVITLVWH